MGKAYRVRLAESSLEKAARLLTDDYKLRVIFRGNAAMTDGKTIILPAVPADAPDSYVEVMTGLLFRESGRVLFGTKLPPQDPQRLACAQYVEDLRMEARLLQEFPGAQQTLDCFHDFSQDVLVKNWHTATQLQRVLNGYFYAQKYGKSSDYEYAVDPLTRAWIDKALECTGPCDQMSPEEALEAGQRLADLLEPLFEDHQKNATDSTNINDQNTIGAQQLEDLSEALAEEVKEGSDEGEEGSDSGPMETELQSLRGDGTYRVYSTECDVIEKIADVDLSEGINVWALREATSDIVTTARRKLLNTLRVMIEAKWSRGHDEGELDMDLLYEIPTRLNEYVFRQRLKALELDCCLALGIDHSYSMTEEKMLLATQCAITLGDVMQPLKLPFMAYGYSTTGTMPAHTPQDVAKEYARWGGHWLGIYHDFDGNWRDGAMRLATAPKNRKQSTLDAESVLYGMRRLLARKEKRKLLFILTDGQPDPGAGVKARCADHLSAVAKLAAQAGVEIVAFGIRSHTVQVYYPNYVVLSTLADIVKEPLTKLDEALRKGRRFR